MADLPKEIGRDGRHIFMAGMGDPSLDDIFTVLVSKINEIVDTLSVVKDYFDAVHDDLADTTNMDLLDAIALPDALTKDS